MRNAIYIVVIRIVRVNRIRPVIIIAVTIMDPMTRPVIDTIIGYREPGIGENEVIDRVNGFILNELPVEIGTDPALNPPSVRIDTKVPVFSS